MGTQIKIQLSERAQQIVAGLQTLPTRALVAIAAAMDQANQLAIAKIQQDHLTGQGPFPVEEHKLGVRTSRLRGSVNATAAVVAGQAVTTSIGSNVIYAAIHEFGGVIKKPARETKVRLRVDARGNLVRQLGHSHLAVFAKAEHKRAKKVNAHIGAHEINMPERAPFRTGIAESMPVYQKKISAAIIAAMKN